VNPRPLSNKRVAIMFLAQSGLDMPTFLQEQGDKTVTSPLTGEKIKLRTLSGPRYQSDPQSKSILKKLFSDWRGQKSPKEKADDSSPESSEAPEPDLEQKLTRDLDSLLGKGATSIDIVKFLKEQEKALLELAGEEPEKESDQFKVDLGMATVTQEARKLLKEYGLSGEHMEELADFSKSQQKSQKSVERIKEKHELSDEDLDSVAQVKQKLVKNHQSALSKYNKAKRKYDLEKEKSDQIAAEVNKQHAVLRAELEGSGEPKGTFESAHAFIAQHKALELERVSAWERAKAEAEVSGKVPPPKPQLGDAHAAWLNEHKVQWEAQPEATRGAYRPPMVSREMFEKIQKAPVLPEPPKSPGSPPKPPDFAEIKREIEKSNPELSQKLGEDLEAIVSAEEFKSIPELKAEFLDSTDDPELRNRVLEMEPEDFEELLKALRSGKKGSLLERVVRVAYQHPKLRAHLLWTAMGAVRGNW